MASQSDDDALDVEDLDRLDEVGRRAEYRDNWCSWRRRNGLVGHEAHEVDPILRVLEDFPRDEPCNWAAAEDDRVLQVHDAAATERARECASDRDEDDRRRPEARNLCK